MPRSVVELALFRTEDYRASFSMWIGKAGVDCFDCTFFLALPRLLFFLFLLISVFFVLDGIVIPPVK